MRKSRHVLRETRNLRAPQPRDPELFSGGEFIVIGGPHVGLRVRVGDHITTLGRDDENSVSLTLDSSVSRYHAVVEWVESRLYIRDRSSTNGTKVNGRLTQGRIALSNLDIIEVGRSALQLNYDIPEEPEIYDLDGNEETTASGAG